jgi:hypothetical protein
LNTDRAVNETRFSDTYGRLTPSRRCDSPATG